MTTGLILDIVVILLLVPTIVYAIILNRRLTALRRTREELSKVVNSFNEATMSAEAGIPKLKKATTEANLTLKDRVEKAQTLRDDLAFMIERAEELAGRLEGAVRSARNEGVVTHGPSAAPANVYQANVYQPAGAAVSARPLAESAPARGYSVAGMGAGAVAPGTLTAATLAQTAAGFEETAAELRNALGVARAEAGVGETRGGAAAPGGVSATAGSPRGANARDPQDGGQPPRRAVNLRELKDGGLAPSRPMRGTGERSSGERTLGERPLADRALAPEMAVDEERSQAERELLKALQSAR